MLTNIGGWASRFLRAAVDEEHPTHGAAAFIGTYWKIDDGAALDFAKAFYAALLQDRRPVGEAVMRARSSDPAAGPAGLAGLYGVRAPAGEGREIIVSLPVAVCRDEIRAKLAEAIAGIPRLPQHDRAGAAGPLTALKRS